MENTMEMKELNLKQMEKISGGVDRGHDGNSIFVMIFEWIFGD